MIDMTTTRPQGSPLKSKCCLVVRSRQKSHNLTWKNKNFILSVVYMTHVSWHHPVTGFLLVVWQVRLQWGWQEPTRWREAWDTGYQDRVGSLREWSTRLARWCIVCVDAVYVSVCWPCVYCYWDIRNVSMVLTSQKWFSSIYKKVI